MKLSETKKNWEKYAKKNPMWSILTYAPKTGWTKKAFFKTGEEEIKLMLKLLKDNNLSVKFKTALDFGCGIGRVSRALGEYFEKVVGIDISAKMIDEANRLNKNRNITYLKNDSDNLGQFKKNSIDLIYSNIVLQHINPEYSKKYIKEFLRIIKNDGLVVFQIPHRANFLGFFKKIFQKIIYHLNKTVFFKRDALVMEMNCISQEEIKHFVESNSARILLIHKDNMAGRYYESYTYFVTK